MPIEETEKERRDKAFIKSMVNHIGFWLVHVVAAINAPDRAMDEARKAPPWQAAAAAAVERAKAGGK